MAEAIILVGGEGTRLRPLTATIPKPMLPVAGVPLVAHQIAKAAAAGVDHVILATAYKAEVFAALGDGSQFGVELESVVEEVPLGTGGAIRNAAGRLRQDGPVVILNGDILSGHDLAGQLAAHRASGAAATLHLVRVADPRAFGCVPTEPDGRIVAFLEKSPDPVSDQINAGCYVFSHAAIDAIPAGRPVSVERETFPWLLAEGVHLHGYLDEAEWLDLGTPAAYLQGCRDVVTGLLPTPARLGPPAERLILPGAQVDDRAVIDDGSVVGAGGVVGAARISGSVLLDDVVVADGAEVIRSAVGRRCRIGAGVRLVDAVLGDDVELPAGAAVPEGARLP